MSLQLINTDKTISVGQFLSACYVRARPGAEHYRAMVDGNQSPFMIPKTNRPRREVDDDAEQIVSARR